MKENKKKAAIINFTMKLHGNNDNEALNALSEVLNINNTENNKPLIRGVNMFYGYYGMEEFSVVYETLDKTDLENRMLTRLYSYLKKYYHPTETEHVLSSFYKYINIYIKQSARDIILEEAHHYFPELTAYYLNKYVELRKLGLSLSMDEGKILEESGIKPRTLARIKKIFGYEYDEHILITKKELKSLYPPVYKCYDLDGNGYKTYKALSEHCRISYKTLIKYIKQGVSLEEILNKHSAEACGHKPRSKTSCLGNIDHLGNVYKNTTEMCRAYNQTPNVVFQRYYRGWSLEAALTGDKAKKVA